MKIFKIAVGLFPSKRQWNTWSLPSKLTAIGFYLALVPLLLGMVSWLAVVAEDFLARKVSIRTASVDPRLLLGFQNGVADRHSNIRLRYPEISYVLPNDFLKQINDEVSDGVLGYLQPGLMEYQTDYEVGVVSPNLVSFKVYQYYYYEGALNGDASEFAYNFDPVNKAHVDFFDVFDARRDALNGLKGMISNKINSICGSGVFEDQFNSASFVPRFFIKNEQVEFVFSEYEVTPGVCGSFTVPLAYNDVQKYLKRDGPLGRLASPSGEWEAGVHFTNALRKAVNEQ